MLNEHKLKSTCIGSDFLPEYKLGIKSVLKDFIRHFDEKGWQRVQFQYFFNNKENFKEKNPEQGKIGNGVCWWLLDEPVFIDDWEALAYYGGILREAQTEMNSGYNICFRIDVSRYDKSFCYLDHLLDISVLSKTAMDEMDLLARRRKQLFGEEYWVYGGLGPVNSSSMDLCLWLLDIYLKGAKGAESWENYAKDSNFEIPSSTAGFYPGNRFGFLEPLVSIRLKAFRKAIELINYIHSFKLAYELNEIQLRYYISHFIPLKGKTVITYEEDAGHGGYENSTYLVLEHLKQHLSQKLLEKQT